MAWLDRGRGADGWVILAEVEGLERRLKELTGVDSGKAKGKS